MISDLVHYLTGKHMSISPQIIEEEAEKERNKLANLIPIGDREICQGQFQDTELETVKAGLKPEIYQ